MSTFEQSKLQNNCPTCKRTISFTIYDIYTKRMVRCSSCGTELRFASSATSVLRDNINERIQWEKRAQEATNIMASAKKMIDEAKRNYDNGKRKLEESQNGLQKSVSKMDTLVESVIDTAEIVTKKK